MALLTIRRISCKVSSLCLVFVVGCQQVNRIGTLELDNKNRSVLTAHINFKYHPNRLISFRPERSGEGAMNAYNKDVFEALAKITVYNSGTNPIGISYPGGSLKLEPRKGQEISNISFKNTQLYLYEISGPVDVKFTFEFDKYYDTSDWMVVSSWSDGP